MSNYTQYKALELPTSIERYSVDIVNKNNQVIDSELHKLDLKNESQDRLLATKEELARELDGKVDKATGMGLSSNDYTTPEKKKLAGIEANANNYVHPQSHPADMITQDANHRFATDEEKIVWNAALESAKDYSNAIYQQATGYTDQKIAENKSEIKSLEEAVRSRASDEEMTAHLKDNTIHVTESDKTVWNNKLSTDGDASNTIVNFTEPTTLTELASGESQRTLFGKLKLLTRNFISLAKLMGSTNISTIGGGTVTGAIASLNSKTFVEVISGTISEQTKTFDITLTAGNRLYMIILWPFTQRGTEYIFAGFSATFNGIECVVSDITGHDLYTVKQSGSILTVSGNDLFNVRYYIARIN